jgi:ribonuclease E
VESVALAVLRALDDQLLRDARHSLIAVTTADVALYILNNKRSFVTDMERRYGISIAVQASDRMQGANFAIERSAAQPAPQRSPARGSVVNMEWGFEGQEAEEEPEEETAAPAPSDREGGGRRPRRRRRRGGRRDERGEERTWDREPRADERAEFAHRGEGEDAAAENEAFGTGPQPHTDLDEPAEEHAGLDEQPSAARGEDEGEGRRGRRRRRGRRGGRRGGRDRDGAQPLYDDDVAVGERHADNGNGAGPSEPAQEPPLRMEAEPPGPAAEEGQPEEPAPVHREEAAPERSWGPAPEPNGSHREPMPAAAEAQTASAAPVHVPEPVHVEPAPEPEDDSRPRRRGWWQRRFSGE